MVLHLGSLSSRGPRELGNGLLNVLIFLTDFWCISLSYIYISVFWRPAFSIHPKSALEFIDDGIVMVTLFCKANGFPRPVIGWLKNSKPVTSGIVSQNENISSLVIVFNETTENPMKYRCIARNSLGSTLSEEATLTVARRETEGRFQRVSQFLIFTTSNSAGTHTFITARRKFRGYRTLRTLPCSF